GYTGPVVGVTGDDKRRRIGHFSFYEIGDHAKLLAPRNGRQPEVYADAVDTHPRRQIDLAKQESALLNEVGRNVHLTRMHDWVVRKDRVAMVPGLVGCVLAVGEIFPDLIGEELVLRSLGPTLFARRLLAVLALHLLEEHEVRADLADRLL